MIGLADAVSGLAKGSCISLICGNVIRSVLIFFLGSIGVGSPSVLLIEVSTGIAGYGREDIPQGYRDICIW